MGIKRKKEPILKPYKKTHAYNYVFKMLKEHIISGAYNVGDRLPTEIELSQTLGISRAATREGLKGLEGVGLITTVPGSRGGRFVKNIDSGVIANGLDLLLQTQKASFAELMEAREAIECFTARKAAIRRSNENLKAMSRVLDLNVDSKEEFYKRNFELHEIVALASQNMVLYYMVQAIRKLIFQTYSNIALEENNIGLVMKTHYDIYSAIKRQDVEGAEKAMIIDICAYKDLYLEVTGKHDLEAGRKEGSLLT